MRRLRAPAARVSAALARAKLSTIDRLVPLAAGSYCDYVRWTPDATIRHVDGTVRQVPHHKMSTALLSAAAALEAAARKPTCYLLCIDQQEARLFDAPGWVRLEPPRDGGVLFIHRERELLVVRSRGVL